MPKISFHNSFLRIATEKIKKNFFFSENEHMSFSIVRQSSLPKKWDTV